jgi:hypothetical protein
MFKSRWLRWNTIRIVWAGKPDLFVTAIRLKAANNLA